MSLFRYVAGILLCVVIIIAVFSGYFIKKKELPPMNSLDDQARAIMGKMTLEDKLRLMDGDTPFWTGFYEMVTKGYNVRPYPAGEIAELGIKGIQFIDGPRGIVSQGATTFPVSMARGATWDVKLEEKVGEAIGKELRALGGTLFGGVCVNLLRHPAWGRAQETYGEDPLILGELGAALTRGVQKHAMACVKHFALNSMETARFDVDVRISGRALHEMYLPHFKRVIDKGNAAAVMSAYNSVNGTLCGQNKILLTDILKNAWGFKGFVLTDFIFGMTDSAKAVSAGLDIEMPFRMIHHQHLQSLVENGQIPMARIDDAVRRILTQQLQWIRPVSYGKEVIGCREHQALAREVAAKSMVLLKNEHHLLPLKGIKKLAVIGELAGRPVTGDGGSSNTRPDYVITPLQGIRELLGDSAQIVYDDARDLSKAVKAAQSADAVVLIAGYTHKDEGEYAPPDMLERKAALLPKLTTPEEEKIARMLFAPASEKTEDPFSFGGDRKDLHLKPSDAILIRAVAAVNKNTIVSVIAGSAVLMEEWQDHVPAIILQWYSGMEGGRALADILAGNVNPGGRLPFAIPSSADHLPYFNRNVKEIQYDLWHGYRKLERDGHYPAFPFGFGLSYSSYAYANLRLTQPRYSRTDTIEASVDITNTGNRTGDEVPQLYIAVIGSRVERARKELKAFTRLSLKAGETKTAVLQLPAADLAYYNEQKKRFVVEPITYEAIVGRHSMDSQALRIRFRIE